MEITQVNIRKIYKDDPRVRAVVSVTLDDEFAVHDIKVIQGYERLFVAMPNRKDERGMFRDIVHPVGSDFRVKLEKAVMMEYEEAMLASWEDAIGSDTGCIAVEE